MSEHGVPDSRLTVIEQDKSEKYSGKGAYWLCECSCREHKKTVVKGVSLRNGRTKSCGCMLSESAIEKCKNKRKYNKYVLYEDYGVLWSSNTNEEIYFDLDDAGKILKYTWMVDINGYPSTNINSVPKRMHSFLGFIYPDHHNRNKLDNRKSNLVECTQMENLRNKSITSKNHSGIIGVHKHSEYDRWIAQIGINNKICHLGTFINKNDAIIARLKAEKEYYGEFAPQRDLFDEYGI